MISFAQSVLFANIRQAISELDDTAKTNDELGRQISSHISDAMLHPEQRVHMDRFDCDECRQYVEEVERLAHQITIGLLEDGTIIFLLYGGQEHSRIYNGEMQDDDCTIHWYSENDSTWVLNDHGTVYYFELPKELYEDWEHSVDKQRKDALRFKREYFSKIVLFHRTEGETEEITILHLSERFMRRAERSVTEESEN